MAVIINRPFQRGALIQELQDKPLPPWASEIGVISWPQFLLKFVLSHPAVTCAIPATSRPEHMIENLEAGRGIMPDAKMRQRIKASIPLIGVGGIFSTQDVITKMEAGANLVQVYTGLVYGGPHLPAKITTGLSRRLDATGLNSITELVGTRTTEWAER